ncbi:hypothetical protein G4B88_015029 [Cannabis sativa]|uniref:Uncharacterized protein n=1 Tax=Cannabis sativa TaxID=3483 RepID=A0A7J6E361_CANSA|nr:hypothetical protein G4B88_015029 [Cannabis sativa]
MDDSSLHFFFSLTACNEDLGESGALNKSANKASLIELVINSFSPSPSSSEKSIGLIPKIESIVFVFRTFAVELCDSPPLTRLSCFHLRSLQQSFLGSIVEFSRRQ